VCQGLQHLVCRESWGQPLASQVLAPLESLEASLQASSAAAQQVSLEEACPQESQAENYGWHEMQV